MDFCVSKGRLCALLVSSQCFLVPALRLLKIVLRYILSSQHAVTLNNERKVANSKRYYFKVSAAYPLIFSKSKVKIRDEVYKCEPNNKVA